MMVSTALLQGSHQVCELSQRGIHPGVYLHLPLGKLSSPVVFVQLVVAPKLRQRCNRSGTEVATEEASQAAE